MEQAVQLLQRQYIRAGFLDWHLITETMIVEGDVTFLGTLLRFVFDKYAEVTQRHFDRFDWFVIERDDGKLTQLTHRLLREAYAYKSPLLSTQIVRPQFGVKKIQFLIDFLAFMKGDSTSNNKNQSRTSASFNTVTHCTHTTARNPKEIALQEQLILLDRRRRELNRTVRQPVVEAPLFLE